MELTLLHMKLPIKIHKHLRTALSAVFVIQLLAASLCFVASASAMETETTSLCHEQMHMSTENMVHQQKPQHHSDACTHYDAPQNLTATSITINLIPAAVLLAIVEKPLTADLQFERDFVQIEKAQAPPDSSTLLLTTTQRFRI